MTSSVHFKFKSQKEPSRVTFDGTGISVFELKREIIHQNRLGDGSDFELAVYNEDTNEEYDDDTTIIPRSTSVIARRLPALRPGKGGAARYVSGKMPVNARSSSRPEPSVPSNAASVGPGALNSIAELSDAKSEDEKIKALFHLQETQWKEQQEDMANATPVPFGRGRGKPINVPDHPPPPGYLCYRCREKGHWIQACPTNNDPNYDGRYRVKRSTGIPRSLQKQVDKPDPSAVDPSSEGSQISGVMVNADGDFVIAQPDKASWELYQEKVKASAAAAAESAAAESSKDLQARGLLCPADRRMFVEPTKTPCCQQTYCNDCISNALIESDFVCPNCATEGVLLDNLTVDEEARDRIKQYESDVSAAEIEDKKNKSEDAKDTTSNAEAPANIVKTEEVSHGLPASSNQATPKLPMKRERASEEKDSMHDPSDAPHMKKQKSSDSRVGAGGAANTASSLPEQPAQSSNAHPREGFNYSPHPQFPAFPGNGIMPPAGFMGEANGLMNPIQGPYASQSGWAQMPGMGMPGPYINNFNRPGMFNPGFMLPNMAPFYAPGSNTNFMGSLPNHPQQVPPYQTGMSTGVFANQQRTAFSGPSTKEEDNAYLRQPVNPHRHQARQKRVLRPSDYREL